MIDSRTAIPTRIALTPLIAAAVAFAAPLGAQVTPAPAQGTQVVELTLEGMVDLAMSSSFQIRQVELNIQRTRHNLRAEQAGLKSRVDLNLQTPNWQAISEARYNSVLGRNEIVRENSQRWQADLSIRQPVILFGRPTNGELSLNSRLYRYKQIEDNRDDDIRYYNRYFVEYSQNLFQPNDLKINLEEAEMDLERSELDFQGDVIDLINNVSEDYFELFEDAYEAIIFERFVTRLEEAATIADGLAAGDPARALEADQVRIELANAREELQRSRSSFRLSAAEIKQDFQMSPSDSIVLQPVIEVEPVSIDVEQAVAYARSLTPRLRRLDMDLRRNEIGLERTEGRQSFRMDVDLSYGREMQDPLISDLFKEPSNSYSVSVSAYVPVWDWGQRKERIAASQINIEQTRLRMEQAETDIVATVNNEVRNLEEFESRAVAMEDNLALATQSAETAMERYREGSASAVDLLQSLDREVDTAQNFLDAFLGWRRALRSLQRVTYFDFVQGTPVLERFGIGMPDGFDGTLMLREPGEGS